MTQNAIILLFIGYTLVREIFFVYSVNKLVNKIMSRNFHDYQQSQRTGQADIVKKIQPPSEEMAEDLGSLQDIGIL